MTEEDAIRALEDLAGQWPPSLVLFSWSGTLCVMRAGEPPGEDAVVAWIDGIPNDGGEP